MLLLARPPIVRWIAALAIVTGALVWEASARRTQPYPFAASSLRPGVVVTDDAIEWRDVPVGTMTVPDLGDARTTTAVTAGDPLTPSTVTHGRVIPASWWVIPMALPPGIAERSAVRLVLPNGAPVSGIVAVPASQDTWGTLTRGAVAVAPEHAEDVARAATSESLMVLVAP